jgi:cytochrome c-type biogenesis protein CcmH
MALWLMLVLMTAAAILAVLWPLSRRGAASAGSDVAVYRDQLEEVARDRAAGLIGEAEAEAARVEVSRRLLAAAATEEAAPQAGQGDFRRRAAAVAGLVFVPLVAIALYLTLGSPQLPGERLAARSAAPQDNRSIQSLVSQVESHIERNPNDGRGWDVLAPVYLRLGRFDDAVKARRNALNLIGETAERQADLGEALVAASNGVVTADAKAAFDRALALEAGQFKSRFFLGMAAQQDGARDQAAAIWRSMLADAPPDAPWTPMVRQALAELGPDFVAPSAAPSAAPVATEREPSAQDVAAAAGMNEAQRTDMIRGMVAGLAARLSQDGSDLDGWLRLLRAYMVLGERDKAHAAAAAARRALANDPDKLRRVEEAIRGLGIES